MSAERAAELQQQSWMLQAAGQLDEAADAAREALRLMEACEGLESPDVANLLVDLAEIQQDRGEFAAALSCAERASRIETALGEQFTGEAAVRIRMRTLGLLGAIRRTLGEYAHAERDLADVLATAILEFGEQSEETAMAQNELGMLHRYWGRFDEAEQLYARALASMAALHGDDSLECATLYHNIGGLLHARGAFAQAEAPARRAWEISQRRRASNDPHVTLDAVAYAAVLEGLQRYDECERIYRAARPILEAAFGTQHAEIAALLHNLAAVLEVRENHEEAESLYRQSLAMRETLLGAGHPDVALTSNNLGALLTARGRSCEARALLERAVAILEERMPAHHPYLASTRANLERIRMASEDTTG